MFWVRGFSPDFSLWILTASYCLNSKTWACFNIPGPAASSRVREWLSQLHTDRTLGQNCSLVSKRVGESPSPDPGLTIHLFPGTDRNLSSPHSVPKDTFSFPFWGGPRHSSPCVKHLYRIPLVTIKMTGRKEMYSLALEAYFLPFLDSQENPLLSKVLSSKIPSSLIHSLSFLLRFQHEVRSICVVLEKYPPCRDHWSNTWTPVSLYIVILWLQGLWVQGDGPSSWAGDAQRFMSATWPGHSHSHGP